MDYFDLEIAKIIIKNEYAMEKNKEIVEKILEKYNKENEESDKK